MYEGPPRTLPILDLVSARQAAAGVGRDWQGLADWQSPDHSGRDNPGPGVGGARRDRGRGPAEAREALGRSQAEWVRVAEVVAAEGADEPDLVELALPAPVARTELEAAFGPGHEAPLLHPDRPREVLYYPPPRADRRHDCAVLARVDGDETRQVTVRRDPRL